MNKILKFLFFIGGIIIVFWSLLPLIINIKRWFIGIKDVVIIYPFDSMILWFYLFIYLFICFILIYKSIKMYFLINNKPLFLYTYMDQLFESPWVYIENKIWKPLDYKFILPMRLIERLFKWGLFLKDGNFYPFIFFYTKVYIFIIYISLIICILVLYFEVLYVKHVYFTFYCLILLLLPKILGFILNRFITIFSNTIDMYMGLFILDPLKREFYDCKDMPNIFFHITYFYTDDRFLIYKYKYLDNRYIFDFYKFNFKPIDFFCINNLRDMFEQYCEQMGLFFKSIDDLFDIKNIQYLYHFESNAIKAVCCNLSDIYRNIEIIRDYQVLIKKHLFYASIFRIFFILLLLSIVLYFNCVYYV